eukprot:TRINITY_DN5449_c0_g1_i1.p1 TRINITY_DN5449_c0_g1~~TRINITY_DN5449_c0_g1_i1.p1  ORF type:complete len:616 (+),score=132.33 TRINITY_DN5449_c0_g1_i1:1510-3357(+)
MVSTFANEVIKLSAIWDGFKSELLSSVERIKGPKALGVDPTLIATLQLVGHATLKERGVNNMFRVAPEGFDTDLRNVVYVVRPKIALMKVVAKHVRQLIRANGDSKQRFFMFMVPRQTLICERVLEEEGVLGQIELRELEMDVIPLDDDLVSMELDTGFRECYLDGDCSSLYYIARAIMKMQAMFGVIPKLHAKGRCAKQVTDVLRRMRQELGDKDGGLGASTTPPEIHAAFLIDRDVDLISPLVTQLTYEGLIDEFWGINAGMFEPPFEVVPQAPPPAAAGGKPAPPPPAAKKIRLLLNSNDTVFAEIRDRNFTGVGKLLNTKAVAIDQHYQQRYEMQKKKISEIRDYMRRLPELQAEKDNLAKHIEIASKITEKTTSDFRRFVGIQQSLLSGEDEKEYLDYVEECINKTEPIGKILRLLALYSAVNNGIKQKQFDFYRHEVTQTYGFEALLTLDNMEKAGLIKRQDGKNNYAALRKTFRLWVDEIDELNPQDIAYVHSGYAPLSVRIVEQGLRPNGWKSVEGVLGLLPGPMIEEEQRPDIPHAGTKVILIVLIGGITFAEISALRFLNDMLRSQHEAEGGAGGRIQFIVCATKIINGTNILDTLFERVGALAS